MLGCATGKWTVAFFLGFDFFLFFSPSISEKDLPKFQAKEQDTVFNVPLINCMFLAKLYNLSNFSFLPSEVELIIPTTWEGNEK